MKRSFISVITSAAALAALADTAAAQTRPDPAVRIGLGPGLTQTEFREFAREFGSVLRPPQLGDATTLGRGRFEVGVDWTSAPIDNTKGAWSHTTADRALAERAGAPRLAARYGLSDRVDIGASGGWNVGSNWGFASVETRIAALRQGPRMPVSLLIRPTLTSLIGPDNVVVATASLDVSVSRAIGALAPYAGFSSTASAAVERSSDLELGTEGATRSPAYFGVAYRAQNLTLAAEVEPGRRTGYALRIGTRF